MSLLFLYKTLTNNDQSELSKNSTVEQWHEFDPAKAIAPITYLLVCHCIY